MATTEQDTAEVVDTVEVQETKEVVTDATAKAAETDPSPVEDEASTLSIVQDVLKEKAPAEASSASGSEDQQPEVAETQAAAEKDPEDYSDVPFHKHPRFREVLGKLKTTREEAEQFRSYAERYFNVENFIAEQGLAPEETRDLLIIGGLIKSDPAEAWKRMLPVVKQVAAAAGEVLPDDLKAMVTEGQMAAEAALEVSRARAMRQTMEVQGRMAAERQQAEQARQHMQSLTQEANTWADERQRRDPNFQNKYDAMLKEIAYLQRIEGMPQTPEGVRAQLDKAYSAVAAPAAIQAPARRAIKPVTGGVMNGTQAGAEDDTLSIINRVVSAR